MHKRLALSLISIICLLFAWQPVLSQDCCVNRGDVDYSGGAIPIDVLDINYLAAYLFNAGPLPQCPEQANVDASGGVNPVDVIDIVYLATYLFQNGPLPPTCLSGNGPYMLEIPFGQTIFVPEIDLQLTFEMVTDSRCPANVFCFWEGEAAIWVKVETSELPYPRYITLPIMGGVFEATGFYQIPIEAFGYRLILTSLMPYPINGVEVSDTDYVSFISAELIEPPPGLNSAALISDAIWVRTRPSNFFLNIAWLAGDVLTYEVGFSGCQPDHFFPLFMSPSSFTGTNPRRAELYTFDLLLEPCDAFFTVLYQVSLTPIIERYVDSYGVLEPFEITIGTYTFLYTP